MNQKPVFALIDCNNFFVSCERVFRPDLANKPVAVLSNNDGCIVARSNEVKALGVPMAVPYFKVKQVLTQHKAALFSANFRLYGDLSQRIAEIMRQACPEVETYSIDESFLQLSSLQITDYESWALALRQKVLQFTGIPVSIGIAPNKTLAKAASEYAKQNLSTKGVYGLVADQQLLPEAAGARHRQLLEWLPVGDIWGVGRQSTPKLQQVGISNAWQLSQVSDQWAQAQLNVRGLRTVKELRGELCMGLEVSDEPQQSIARTRSFGHTVRDYNQLEAAIATFAAQAAAMLRTQHETTETIMVFLRTPKRLEATGSSTVVRLLQPTNSTGDIIAAALEGLERLYDSNLAYKKGGVVLIKLASDERRQLSLLVGQPSSIDRETQLMQAVDQINSDFGSRLVRHASENPLRSNWHGQRGHQSPGYTTNWQELPIAKA
jgi:DNA polymerase V